MSISACSKHKKNKDSAVKLKYNVTKMKDYASGSHAWIDPYAFPLGGAGAPSCSPYNETDFHCGDGSNGNPFCFNPAITNDSYFQPATSGSVAFQVGNYHNCYSQSNTTASYAKCRLLGFKNLYGRKTQHGRPSYTSRLWSAMDNYDWCGENACQWHNADLGVDTTRYLTISANSSFSSTQNIYDIAYTDAGNIGCDSSGSTCTDCTGDCACFMGVCFTSTLRETDSSGGNASSTVSIDKYGNIVTATCSSGSFGCDPSDDSCQPTLSSQAFGLLSMANDNVSGLLHIYSEFISSNVSTYGAPASIVGSGTNWTVTWNQDLTCLNYCGTITSVTSTPVAQCSITANSVDIYKFDFIRSRNGCTTDGECPVQTVTIHYHYSYTDTSFTYYKDTFTPFGGADLLTHEECNASLSNPYTSQQVSTDIDTAMKSWTNALTDNVSYPWRTDQQPTQGPLCCYDESTGGVIPSIGTCTTSILYTGRLLGAPAPSGLIPGVWIPDHENYCVCQFVDDFGENCSVFYGKEYGAWSNDVAHCPSATKALTLFESNNMPFGALAGNGFMKQFPSSCNDGDPFTLNPEVMYKCIWAEIVHPKESYNYARPCALDRFQISTPSARCVSSSLVDGSGNVTVNIEPSAIATDIATGNYVWIAGTATEGLYKVTSASDHTVITSPLVMSGSWLSESPITDGGKGIIAKLRWQTLAPAVCGQLPIDRLDLKNPVTCSFNGDLAFIDNDIVTISNADWLNGSYTIKRLGAQSIALLGTNGTNKVYAGSGVIQSTFTIDPIWNTNKPNNDFTVRTWTLNYRDVNEYNRISGAHTDLESQVGCDGVTACPLPTVFPAPRPYQQSCGLDQGVVNTSTNPICRNANIKRNACVPTVAYFSPFNIDFGISSENFGFFTPLLDVEYITLWNANVKQADTDYLWQAPPCVCDNDADVFRCTKASAQDNGSCLDDSDSTTYYPMAGQYEARCSPPAGAPHLPNDAYQGCLNSDNFGSGGCPQGNICNPPPAPNTFPLSVGCGNAIYLVYNSIQPWADLLNRESCVCSNGRFDLQYMDNGISCTSGFVLPPF